MMPLLTPMCDLLCLAFTGLPLASQLSLAHTALKFGVYTTQQTYAAYKWLQPTKPTKVNLADAQTFITIQDIQDEDGETMVLLTAIR
jgi:hypothetical protein